MHYFEIEVGLTNWHEMNQGPDIPLKFSDLKCHKAEETIGKTFVDEVTEVEQLLSETNSENIFVDPLLAIDKQYPRTYTGMDDVSHEFEFGFTSNYGGLGSCNTLEGEEGLKLEVFDGFLDEVDDICATQDLSFACNHFLLDFEFAEKVSGLDSGLHGASNSASESHSPGSSGSIDGGNGGSETSNKVVPETKNRSLNRDVAFNDPEMLRSEFAVQNPAKESLAYTSNAVQNPDEMDDDEKPIASFLASEKNIQVPIQETELRTCFNKRNLRKSMPRLETSSQAAYDFRPRRACTKKCPPTMVEDEQTATEFEDDHPKPKAPKSRSDRRKHQRMWTHAEIMKLVDGVSQFGVGKWTDIKRLLFPSVTYRTPVDLRDKWRNLLRASYSRKSSLKQDYREVDRNPRHTMRPLPSDIVHRIDELAELHPYPNTNSLLRRTPRRKNQI